MEIQKKSLKLIGFIVMLTVFVSANKSAFFETVYGLALCQTELELPQYQLNNGEKIVVAVDLGHGGNDTGAEKIVDEIDIIETTGAYLFELLEKDERFSPIYTREIGKDPSSDERAEIINSNKAQLVISLHCNCDFSGGSTHGFECYPTPPGRLYHPQSLQFATIICQKMKENGHYLRGDAHTGIKYAYYSGDNKTIVDGTDTKERSQKSFGIVDKVSCPSVLVEQCFLNNYNDVEQWATDDGMKKAAQIYYDAFCEYFFSEN